MAAAMKAQIRQNVDAALQVLLERAPLVQRNYILDGVKYVFGGNGHHKVDFELLSSPETCLAVFQPCILAYLVGKSLLI